MYDIGTFAHPPRAVLQNIAYQMTLLLGCQHQMTLLLSCCFALQ